MLTAIIFDVYGLRLLLLFGHSTNSSIGQVVCLHTSTSLAKGVRLPHAIEVKLHAKEVCVVILTAEAVDSN